MSTTVYIYAGAPGDAALYLREQSALANCTEVFGTTWANEDCLRVTLDTPFPSEGERLLWAALCSLNDGGKVDLHECAAHLDADSLTALWVAVGIAFGCGFRTASSTPAPDSKAALIAIATHDAAALGAVGGRG